MVFDAITTSSSFIPSSPLSANRTYYWRVSRLRRGRGIQSMVGCQHFLTRLPAPALIVPANAGGVNATPLTFEWEKVIGATGYYIQISTSSSFKTYVLATKVQSSSYSRALTKGKKYYWRVYAKGTYSSVWSEIRNFITK